MNAKNRGCLGEHYPSKDLKNPLLIIMLNCMGGHVQQLKHHIAFLNSAGFDVYTYPAFLQGTGQSGQALAQQLKLSKGEDVLKIWAKELKTHLKSLPQDRPKALFAFSLPSLVALQALSNNLLNIRLVVCDSGPFLNFPFLNFPRAVWRLLSVYYALPFSYQKVSLGAKMLWAFRSLVVGEAVRKVKIPPNVKVLSLRAERDQLVPPADIARFFKKIGYEGPAPDHLKVCHLKQSQHLTGLKDQPVLYKTVVLDFLSQSSTKTP